MLKNLIQRDLSRNRENAINIAASIVNFAITSLIGFFISPYIVSHIGVEANGFVSLAHNFTAYASLATAALNSMASRFLMIAYYKGETDKANRIYSSVFFANLIIAIIIGVASVIVVIRLEYILQVPKDILLSVKVLFASILANFAIATAITSWSTAPYVKNKLYLSSISNVVNSVLRASVIVALFSCFVPSVSYVGIATLAGALVCLVYSYYCKKYLLKIKAHLSNFSWHEIYEIISAGIWNSISALGNILIHGLDLLLANIFLDANAMGILAVAKTMPLMVSALNETIANVFAPSFIIDYAKDDTPNIIHTVNVSSKIISVICTIPLGFLFVYGESFYSLWQPSLDSHMLFVLSTITILGRVFFTGMQPLFNIFTVVNKVKPNSIITIINGLISFLLTLLVLRFTDLGIYAIAGVSVVCCFLKNIFFVVPFSAKYLGLKATTFFTTIWPSIICCCILLIFGGIEKSIIRDDNWIMLAVSAVIYASVGLVLTSLVVLNKAERNVIISKVFKL